MPQGPNTAEVELGARIRALRLSKAITQAALAESANVSLGALKALEQGRGSTTRTLSRVMAALGEDGWPERIAPTVQTFNPLSLLDRRPRKPAVRRRAPKRSRP